MMNGCFRLSSCSSWILTLADINVRKITSIQSVAAKPSGARDDGRARFAARNATPSPYATSVAAENMHRESLLQRVTIHDRFSDTPARPAA
ncbi:MAG: hypothetical protein HY322_11780 [Betaproteobacteria bacterium]|nr:hypothetical protein [Betaproteobacteria bacterium]